MQNPPARRDGDASPTPLLGGLLWPRGDRTKPPAFMTPPSRGAQRCRGAHRHAPRAGRPAREALPWTLMRQSKSTGDVGHVPADRCVSRSVICLAGLERLSHRSHGCAHTGLLSGRFPAVRRLRPPIPLAAGTAFRRRDPSTGRRLSAQSTVGHSPPDPAPVRASPYRPAASNQPHHEAGQMTAPDHTPEPFEEMLASTEASTDVPEARRPGDETRF